MKRSPVSPLNKALYERLKNKLVVAVYDYVPAGKKALYVGLVPRTPFDGQYKQMVNCTLREVLRKCQNTVQNLKWKQLNV